VSIYPRKMGSVAHFVTVTACPARRNAAAGTFAIIVGQNIPYRGCRITWLAVAWRGVSCGCGCGTGFRLPAVARPAGRCRYRGCRGLGPAGGLLCGCRGGEPGGGLAFVAVAGADGLEDVVGGGPQVDLGGGHVAAVV